MEIKKLNTLIATIGKASAKLREQIQEALVGCAEHAIIHRNTDPFNRLFQAVGSGTRLEGMLRWASIYAPVYFKDGKVVLADKRQKEMIASASPEEVLADLAAAEKWYALAAPEPVANPWDSGKFAERQADNLKKAAEKAEKNGDHKLAELLSNAELVIRVALNSTYDVVEAE